MSNKLPVSVSRVTTHSICPRRFYYKYERGLEPTGEGVSPRMLGLVVHHILAEVLKVYHGNPKQELKDWFLKLGVNTEAQNWDDENRPNFVYRTVDDEGRPAITSDDEKIYAWDEMMFKAKDIAYRTLVELDIPNKYRVASDAKGAPLVEYDLHYQWQPETTWKTWGQDIQDLPTYFFRGRLDAVLESVEHGYNVLVDFKTKGSGYRTEEAEALAAQIGLYQHVLWMAKKIHAPMGLLFQIKARVPEAPTKNLNGTMSRRKIVSTWEVYETALLENDLDPQYYEEEMRPKLDAVEWFRVIEVVRTEEITGRMWNNFQEQVYRMDADTTYPRVFSPSTCPGCDFYRLCDAYLYGHDEEGIIEERYTQQSAELQLFPIGISSKE